MGQLIKQEPLKKVKYTQVELNLTESTIARIMEYCKYAGITYGVENGIPKTNSGAIQKYFIEQAILRVLDEDNEEIQRLKKTYIEEKPKDDVLQEQLELVSQAVLGEDMEDLVAIFD